MNKYLSHLPITTVTVKILGYQRILIQKIARTKHLYIVSFLALPTSLILCNILLCRLRLEEFTKRIAVHFNSSSYFLLYILRYKWNKLIADGLRKSLCCVQLQTPADKTIS